MRKKDILAKIDNDLALLQSLIASDEQAIREVEQLKVLEAQVMADVEAGTEESFQRACSTIEKFL